MVGAGLERRKIVSQQSTPSSVGCLLLGAGEWGNGVVGEWGNGVVGEWGNGHDSKTGM